MAEYTTKYLGDGVYMDFDGFTVTLTTQNGVETTNTIYLDPEIVDAFIHAVQQLREVQ